MTERPRFNKLNASSTKDGAVRAFNELVDFYNELADEYEELFVLQRIRTEAMQMLDGRTLAVFSSVAQGHEERVRKEGYDAYKKRVLSGQKENATA